MQSTCSPLHIFDLCHRLLAQELFLIKAMRAPIGTIHCRVQGLQLLSNPKRLLKIHENNVRLIPRLCVQQQIAVARAKASSRIPRNAGRKQHLVGWMRAAHQCQRLPVRWITACGAANSHRQAPSVIKNAHYDVRCTVSQRSSPTLQHADEKQTTPGEQPLPL